jgi:hypothetical protein
MRSKIRVIGAALVSALVVAAVYSTTSASAGGNDTKVLRLSEQNSTGTDLDLGEPGFGPGDQFVFRGKLFKGSERVGTTGGACVVVAVFGTKADTQCQATLRLKHGQIALQGLITFVEEESASFTVAVTGGTGKYRNAHGEATITDQPDGSSDYVIRLT